MSLDQIKQLEGLSPADIQRHGPQEMAAAVNSLVSQYPEHADLEPGQQDELFRLAKFLERVDMIYNADPTVLFVVALAFGKAGEYDQAIRAARVNYDRTPGWLSAISLANAYRRRGDLKPAIEMFRKSVEHDPSKYQSMLDVGDLSVLDGQIQQGLAAYEEVLAREPKQPWALASSYYCRYQLMDEQQWLDKLNDIATSTDPDMEQGIRRALSLLEEMGLEPPVPEEHRDVWLATRVLQKTEATDPDPIVEELIAAGVPDRKRAIRLYHLVPIAWGRLLLESMGVSAPNSYKTWNPKTDKSTEHRFDQDPLYQEIMAVLPAACAQATQEQAQRMLMRSSEINAVNQALDAGSDLRDLILSPPMFMSED